MKAFMRKPKAAHESRSETVRLCSRHQARCLRELETNICPNVYREIVLRHFSHLRSDLVDEIYKPLHKSRRQA